MSGITRGKGGTTTQTTVSSSAELIEKGGPKIDGKGGLVAAVVHPANVGRPSPSTPAATRATAATREA